MRASLRAPRRWTGAPGAAVAVLVASLIAGCGGQSATPPSTSAPVSPLNLLSDISSTATGSHAYTSVLATSGSGSRQFTRPSWPRHIAVEMSCRGGPAVEAAIGNDLQLKVWCAPDQAGGNTKIIGQASRLRLTAAPHTRWSLVVVDDHP